MIKFPSAFNIYSEKAKDSQEVTPEFLKWLEIIHPREGVGANEAWNAALTLAEPSDSWMVELGELAIAYAVAHANLRVAAERGDDYSAAKQHNDEAFAAVLQHGHKRVRPLKEIR